MLWLFHVDFLIRKNSTIHFLSSLNLDKTRHQIMFCKLNSSNPPFLCKFQTKSPKLGQKTVTCSSNGQKHQQLTSAATETQVLKADAYSVKFRTLGACKLGISRYPDFEYDAGGGRGSGSGTKVTDGELDDEISVSFDSKTLYIPPLSSATTRFLGLPLPPFLKIEIAPELFQGRIDRESGKIDLEFMAKFWFSVGTIYRAPPLLVKTVLTSEESKGTIRSGRGKRLDKEGKCRLVGVATVDPIDDFLMNTFLGLPTECLANLNAVISLSNSS